MKLHLPGLPHTVTNDDFSHCAFTGKVKRFGPMLRAQGYEVIHYGVEGSDAGASEHVELMSTEEHLAALGIPRYHDDPKKLIGDYARSDNEVYRLFNFHLKEALEERLEPGDIICLPFGAAHDPATQRLALVRSGEVLRVETGIGYSDPVTLNRIYESEAWRHWTMGREMREGMGWKTPRLDFVIPNYYDLDHWPFLPEPLTTEYRKRVVFFGRIEDAKGCAIVPALARAYPELIFTLCGQGDATPYLTEPNIEYIPPKQGHDRAPYLGNALCAIFPSRFVEPFCGAAVEAMLCGTPVLTSDFGAFTETNIEHVTGFRCGGEQDWIDAIPRAAQLSRDLVSLSARQRFSMGAVGPRYDRAFQIIADAMASRRPLVSAAEQAVTV